MTQEQIAKSIYYSLKKHGYETACKGLAYKDLPRDLMAICEDFAEDIPQPDPLEALRQFKLWAESIRHPDAIVRIDSFCLYMGIEL